MNKLSHPRLYYFENFRALAILLIVFAHCYYGWDRNLSYEKLISNAIDGGTILFVFISGFFLHRVFYRRGIVYKDFIRKKFVAVGVPFIVMSFLYMFLFWVVTGNVPTHHTFEEYSMSEVVLLNFLTGRHLAAYWYIPFILIIFLLTPIFYSFIKLKPSYQIWITSILLVCASFFWRPIYGINPIHSVLYFAPFYFLGIIYSLNETKFIYFLTKYKVVLFFLWLLSLLLMLNFGQIGNANKINPFSYEGVDLMVLQKSIMIFLIIALMYNYANQRISFLSLIADYSFPVFFIHGWVILLSNSLFDIESHNFIEVSLNFGCVFFVSLLLGVVARRVLGRNSRYFVGA
ncbi:MAG: acyltransferase [Oceanicoccus sp.]|uniref:acyltransferase family protein n=1 Tax=Oceanicoccus sp. TaxID=2691044 RepID=UPI0026359476|nr:acyltransferase [Oceanicoccus sp.]MDG1771864.1 acyltransferase [Oceanicoccus sp.]